MRDPHWFDHDDREGRFFSQLPSVLVAAVAISLIVLVNAGGQPSASSPLPVDAERNAAPMPAIVSPPAKPVARAAESKSLPATAERLV